MPGHRHPDTVRASVRGHPDTHITEYFPNKFNTLELARDLLNE